MRKILVAEDEDAIRDFIVLNLKRAGYDVVETTNGREALEAFAKAKDEFDIAVLDIMMPEVDGFEVCSQLRAANNTMGIIILSAKSQEMDKVRGLMLGADDYMTKPFSPSELLARVDAIYRRITRMTPVAPKETKTGGPFSIDEKSRIVRKNGETLDLTQVEYLILQFLMAHPNKAVSRQEIMDAAWGKDFEGDEKIVDVNVRRLRIKIEDDPSSPHYLTTVWGFGYKWMTE